MAAAKRLRVKECKCSNEADKLLKERGFMVTVAFSLTGGCTRAVIDLTRRANTPKRVKAPILAANFCPFCGKEYPI
jgi:hypothetical protein